MTWREISAAALNSLPHPLIIDVRSPCEHEAERIPQSLNVPLLSNDERAEVGVLYKERGELVARRHALALISPKIPVFVEEIIALRRHGQPLVVYCWRGGLRSESVASVLSIAGVDCHRLTGGYKAWRAEMLRALDADEYPFQAIVLHGLTGVGKTEILSALKRNGFGVLDLEQMARHRGSVFGALGLGGQPSQKNFEAAIWEQLRALDRGQLVFIEAESRKIGRLGVPDCIFHRIASGTPILVTGSLATRAKRISLDYVSGSHSAESIAKGRELLLQLKDRLGNKKIERLNELVAQERLVEAVEILLTDYYDPLYMVQIERKRPFALEVCSDNIEEAVEKLSHWAHLLSSQSSGVGPAMPMA